MWFILLIAFIIVIILLAEFSCPPDYWRNAHRPVKRKNVQDWVE